MSCLQFTAKLNTCDLYMFHYSVLDLNAFERQNKAEGLGMVTEEGSGIVFF